jgi:hypothetical protein
MRKICLLIVFLLFSVINLYAQEINFPPELLWWLNEIKKANPNIEINKFTFNNREIKKFSNSYQRTLVYPVFMRWNYSGNTVGYYDYHRATLERQMSGKYGVGNFDDVSTLLLADRNKKVFFGEDYGIASGLDAICWLTDTVLIGVGLYIHDNDNNEIYYVNLFIKEYKINNSNKTVEIKEYVYEKAFESSKRVQLKLKSDWYKQRPDYFEIDK